MKTHNIYQNADSYTHFKENLGDFVSNAIRDILNHEYNLFELLSKRDITLINSIYSKHSTLINEVVTIILKEMMYEWIEQYKYDYIHGNKYDYTNYVNDAIYHGTRFFRETLEIEEDCETIEKFVDNFNTLSRGNINIFDNLEVEEVYEETIAFQNDNFDEPDEFILDLTLNYKIEIDRFLMNITDFNEFLQVVAQDND